MDKTSTQHRQRTDWGTPELPDPVRDIWETLYMYHSAGGAMVNAIGAVIRPGLVSAVAALLDSLWRTLCA